jgi:hypothetical protein
VNKCPHCPGTFNGYVEYQEHLVFSHLKPQDIDQNVFAEEIGLKSNLKTYSSGRTDLGKTQYRPMDPAEKRRIVASFERRWAHAVIGGLLVLAFVLPARADDDEGSKAGPQGPQGIQGVTGPQGKTGIAGSQGAQGASGQDGSTAHAYGGLNINLLVYSNRLVDVGLFNATYAAPSDWANVTGVSLSFGLVDSYEARQRKAQDRRIEELERLLAVKFVTGAK